MGRLLDLAQSSEYTLGNLAAACLVSPELLQRIDQGAQPLPVRLAQTIARVLHVELSSVLAAVAARTELEEPALYNALPPALGDPIPPFRVVPAAPAFIPQPAAPTEELFAFLGPSVIVADGSTVVERYSISAGGVLVYQNGLGNSEPNGYPAGLLGCISGVMGTDGKLWVGGDNFSALDPLTFRINRATLALAGLSDLYTWTGVGLQTFAKGARDPVTGRVWVTIADGNVYAFDPADVSAGPAVVALTVEDSIQLCGALCFPGDGFLYVITGDVDTGDLRLQKIDPSPGSEAVVAVTASPVADPTSAAHFMLEWVEGESRFYSGAVGGLNKWDRSTLALDTFVDFGLGESVIMGGAYDVTADAFWCVNYDFETPTNPVQLKRDPVSVGFSGSGYDAGFGIPFSPGLSSARVAFFSGTDAYDTGLQTVFAFSMDGTPALLAKTLVGRGGSGVGSNCFVGSVLVAAPAS